MLTRCPAPKLVARYPRTRENLRRAVRELPHVIVLDNSDLARPFRRVAYFLSASATELNEPLPSWLPRP